MALVRPTAPTLEPVTLDEAKTHCVITSTDDDTFIGNLITTAREKVESDTNRSLITQTWEQYLDCFPWNTPGAWPAAILLEPAPLQSVTSLTYIDTDGATQTLTEGVDFTVDTKSEPARIVPFYGTSWPSTRAVPNAVTITIVTGFGDAPSDVPERFKQAMKLLISHWNENREAIITGTMVEKVPFGYENIIASLKVTRFA